MKTNEEMIDAIGEVIPKDSSRSRVSLKESDCYALIDGDNRSEQQVRNPVSVVYESIVWGSRVLKSHPLYWADKRKLMTRILRSANTALFTVCKEHVGSNAVTAMVGFRGNTQLWIAVVGQVCVWTYGDSYITGVYPNEGDNVRVPLGTHRYGFAPDIISVPFRRYGYTIVSMGSISQLLLSKRTTPFPTVTDIVSVFMTVETPGAWIIIPHNMR
jgi:hypothetical protein